MENIEPDGCKFLACPHWLLFANDWQSFKFVFICHSELKRRQKAEKKAKEKEEKLAAAAAAAPKVRDHFDTHQKV